MKKSGLLKELTENLVDAEQLADELSQCGDQLSDAMDQMSILNEAEEGEKPKAQQNLKQWNAMMAVLNIALKQFEAAKKGLSIVSRLPVGENRKKHAGRVMSNMNKIRGSISRVNKQIGALTSS